jgi:hypothetical protein
MRLEAKLPKNDKSRRISAIQRPLIWCGEGDLNPHEIAPASTSSGFPVVGSVPTSRKLLIFHVRPFPSGPIRSHA